MSERADHLIERAAALLRQASPVQPAAPLPAGEPGRANGDLGLAERAAAAGLLPLPGAVAVSSPVGPSAPALRNPPTGLPPAPASPLLVPPSRSAPIQFAPDVAGAASPPPAKAPPRPGTLTSAADIPASPSRPQIAFDMLERAGLVVARTKRTRIAEEYRIVIGRILRALHAEPEHAAGFPRQAANLVMVTSAKPGEGKTFTALNLAASIAQNAGESVLLVDVDPKVRPLSDQLGLGEARGFLDLVSDPAMLPDELVLPTSLTNLSFVPLGTRPTGAAGSEVDDGAAIRPIGPAVRRLSERYPNSLIVLDAPPCLSTSDPHTLSAHVGQVVIVVEAERTQRSEVEAAIDLVRVCPSVTMLLNKVRLTTSHTFGAYDYFGSYT